MPSLLTELLSLDLPRSYKDVAPDRAGIRSIFRHDLAWAQAKRFCDLSRLGQHHAGLARDGYKLKTLGQAPLSGIGVQNVNAWSDAMLLGGLEDVLDGVGELVVRDVRAPHAPRGVGDERNDDQLEDQLDQRIWCSMRSQRVRVKKWTNTDPIPFSASPVLSS